MNRAALVGIGLGLAVATRAGQDESAAVRDARLRAAAHPGSR